MIFISHRTVVNGSSFIASGKMSTLPYCLHVTDRIMNIQSALSVDTVSPRNSLCLLCLFNYISTQIVTHCKRIKSGIIISFWLGAEISFWFRAIFNFWVSSLSQFLPLWKDWFHSHYWIQFLISNTFALIEWAFWQDSGRINEEQFSQP